MRAERLERMATGIQGFDEMMGGGLIRGRTALVTGGPGTGKTVFALQALAHGASHGEPGICVAMEEDAAHLQINAASFGWNLPRLARSGKLVFLDARLDPDTVRSGTFELSGLLSSLAAQARAMRARRVVLDGLDVLLDLLGDPAAERREMYRVHRWLLASGLTAIVTARESGESDGASGRNGSLQFMADTVILLRQRVHDRTSLRSLRILKNRGGPVVEHEAPLMIGPQGMEVAGVIPALAACPASTQRVGTGVERLDAMLCGGYFRGSSVLITGSPGTAKTTLAGAFAAAMCRRGETTVFCCFDEDPAEVIRNLKSVGLDLGRHVKSGSLRLAKAVAEVHNADEHYMMLRALLRETGARALIVDPVSAMAKAGGLLPAMSVAQRLIHFAKSQGVTTLYTSLLSESDARVEAASLPISTIADTWIHVSYVVQGGERNRALTIVKSRGTGHSKQVRELVLTGKGPTLTDVYASGGDVLMGTARWEKEEDERRQQERTSVELERSRRELALAETEIGARMGVLDRELEAKREALGVLERAYQIQRQRAVSQRETVAEMRGADAGRRNRAKRRPHGGTAVRHRGSGNGR